MTIVGINLCICWGPESHEKNIYIPLTVQTTLSALRAFIHFAIVCSLPLTDRQYTDRIGREEGKPVRAIESIPGFLDLSFCVSAHEVMTTRID